MVRLIVIVLSVYLLLMLSIYIFQRSLQYHPSKTPLLEPAEYDVPYMNVVKNVTEDGLELTSWFVPPKEKTGRIIVMFHGNAGNLSDRAAKVPYYYEKGYGVYLAGYRGYGGNAGRASEAGLYRDAEAALKWLEDQGYSPAQFIIYGESIGTGVAVEMALRHQPKTLILEAPFTSATNVAKVSYFWLPVHALLKDKFESIKKIKDITSTLLIIHGDEDLVVPFSQGKALYAAANHPKEMIEVFGGGHSDLYDHHAGYLIAEWLEKQEKNNAPQ